ncbi:hypothetical protein DXG01_000597, partial [Tephrocybe rancida]
MAGQSTRSNMKLNNIAPATNRARARKNNKRRAPIPVEEREEEVDLPVIAGKSKVRKRKALSPVGACKEDVAPVNVERPMPRKRVPGSANLDHDTDENFMLSSACQGLKGPERHTPCATVNEDPEPPVDNISPSSGRSLTPDGEPPCRSPSPPDGEPPSRSPSPPDNDPPHCSPSRPRRSLSPPDGQVSPRDSEDSGLDFKQTTTEADRQLSRLSPSRRPITMEEQDEEYDQELEAEVENEEGGAHKQSKKSRGKTRAAEGDDDSSKACHKPGPLPEAAKDAMDILYAQFVRGTQQLTAQYNKSPSLLFQHVGQGLTAPRYQMNRWNAFQIHYNVNGDLSRCKDMSHGDWTKFVRNKCDDYCKEHLGENWEDEKARKECLQTFVDWHKQAMAENPERIKHKGSMEEFNFTSAMAFIHSTMFGCTPEYERVKITNPKSFNGQLTDFDTQIRVEVAKAHGKDIVEDLLIRKNPGEEERDFGCRALPIYLRRDYSDILVKRGTYSHKESQLKKFPWMNWADTAIKNKLRMVCWDPKAHLPQHSFTLTSVTLGIPHAAIKQSVDNRALVIQGLSHDDYIRIESWMDIREVPQRKQEKVKVKVKAHENVQGPSAE